VHLLAPVEPSSAEDVGLVWKRICTGSARFAR
jgi:hypothetical protein